MRTIRYQYVLKSKANPLQSPSTRELSSGQVDLQNTFKLFAYMHTYRKAKIV